MVKNRIFQWVSLLFIVITVGVNLYGFFHLPDVIATQFSLTASDNVNHMPSPVYLIGTLLLIIVLSVLTITKSKEQKLKYLLINTLLFFANIILIVTQL